ncbi:nucleoside-diphosphate kinase [Blochmannia endosymbiont of Colobopsis nipponica]|uniref:nucleoside-diphosphate kinase n=1 Tax=Blochmannia endosymbiont of Colobopsis nipponica TaxID=2681987 RepID=UPI001785DDF0|nr:nucleoside-diphosphate kinase [Blochmannia endosymbiont of Colobopsis nipponica]QOI11346.1 nucleoside-diphosphate kinase [Blochmannia endosymbiont of Colobopsis nipponica]
MKIERTFSIIKPDAFSKNIVGKIISRLEDNNFVIVAFKMIWLTLKQAEYFYFEHKYKSFFNNLINFMISGPLLVQVLEGEDIISRYRKIIGNTDPANASLGTLRADFADNIMRNIVHGSDSKDSAVREISYFFSDIEIYTRN